MRRASKTRGRVAGDGFVRTVVLEREGVPSFDEYPFSIPAIRNLDECALHHKVTFFVGENGSGKSTLLEAIAVKAGFNAEGGTRNFRFAKRPSESVLQRNLRLVRGPRRRHDGFFFRAESYFNLATNIEELDREPAMGPPIINSYGGTYLHDMSHGESFMALVQHRFGPDSLFVLDEPEAALSPSRQLSLLKLIHDHVEQGGSQFVIATHSPILLAYPDAVIYHLGEGGLTEVPYKETEHHQIARDFLRDPDRFFGHLLDKERPAPPRSKGDGFVRSVMLERDRVPSFKEYPFSIAAVRGLDECAIDHKVTFFVGENGSGKSTLLEAIAVAAGFNAEGGSRNFAFATRSSESALHQFVRLARGTRRCRDGFFLRAESYFNVATQIDELGVARSYGGTSLHEQSHGESFLALVQHRFKPEGLFILDEPEAALSPSRQLSLLKLIHRHVEHSGSQFIMATHSPILLAYPGALIHHVGEDGLAPIAYSDTEHYRITQDFLRAPERFLAHLLSD